MQVQAQHVKSGDLVRGIGLRVEFSEPESEFTTRLEGQVGYPGTFFSTKVVLPSEHLVNVRRPFAVGDQVTIPTGYVELVSLVEYLSGFETAALSGGYMTAEVVEVRADERQVVVTVDGENYAVPFKSARHATV